MKIQQGEIFLSNLNPTKGHEQSGYRPVLIMQNDILNKNLTTVIVVPLTGNLAAKGKLTTFFLRKETSGLDQDSVVLLFQVRTIDKLRLEKKIGKLNRGDFSKVLEHMRFIW